MLFTLLDRAFKLCSNFDFFSSGNRQPKTIFENNGYPKGFVAFCIKKYLDNVLVQKEVVLECSKKELICVLSFTGKKSLQLRTRLVSSKENNLKLSELKVIFQSPCKLNLLFRFKDSLKRNTCSDIIYRNTCSNCKVTYYDKSYRHLFTRSVEHMDISNLTGKRLKRN